MNMRFLGQNMLQIMGLIYASIKYKSNVIDSIEDYIPEKGYALPFDGEWYAANGGITRDTSHSWEILPQRFAYDFIVIDEDGKSYHGDKKDLRSYYCYGKEILAPAHGIVAAVKNNFPDCRIMDDGEPDPDTPDIAGNRIIIRHSSNEYSTVCHLMPGSVRVQKGQAVKKGERIARCGNSGNTTEPHIHFQLQNTAHFYSCIGIPVIFPGIESRIYAEYHSVDPRPLPEKEDGKDGYIHRGLFVKNMRNE